MDLYIDEPLQVDNGAEFLNDKNKNKSEFEKVVGALCLELKRMRLFFHQNGKIEKIYKRRVFISGEGLIKQAEKHERRYKNRAKTVLNFKGQNKILEYFSKCNILRIISL